MSKLIALPPYAVLVLVIRAETEGPHVDINVSEEWWAGASKEHRKAAFIAAVDALGRAGARVIPEEFGPGAERELEAMQHRDDHLPIDKYGQPITTGMCAVCGLTVPPSTPEDSGESK